MDLNEIESIIKSEAGLSICPICGTPFKPYHSRQKTCGSIECQMANRANTVKRRTKELKEERPEEYKESRRKSMQRYRQKKKANQMRESQLKELSEQWEKQLEFDKKISEYGIEYGKRSADKVLASVPKINVNIEKTGEENG